ncbi:MAG: YicC/YloC family endoribonuclease [Xanthobacteraceae bacterium]
MALSSMTGFARQHGVGGASSFEWELRSVNAKGLDLRLRIPPGFDAVEPVVRKRATDMLARGTVYANLAVKRADAAPVIRVNDEVLASIMTVANELSSRTGAAPPTVDGLLAIKGVIELIEPEETDEARKSAEAAIVGGFEAALRGLVEMREREGGALRDILLARLDEISVLAKRADAAPGRHADAVKARLKEQIATLLETSDRFDPDRLHQEAVMIAARADIREELDRIAAHVAQARELLAKGGAVGRRLDFLAQEFNREVNTTCSKANDLELTNIGLELKNIVEQFREQVQNLE